MDSSGSPNGHYVVCTLAHFVNLERFLQLIRLLRREAVPRADDVGPVRVPLGQQRQTVQHCEHLRGVATAAKYHEQVSGVASGRFRAYGGCSGLLAVENIGDTVEDEVCQDESDREEEE